MDVKELVAHVGQVHFALSAICLGLLIIAHTDQSSDRRVARSQLTALESALSGFNAIPDIWDPATETAANDAGFKALERQVKRNAECPFPVMKNSVCVAWETTVPLTYKNQAHKIRTIIALLVPPAYVPVPLADFRSSLADFGDIRQFWDALMSPLFVARGINTQDAKISYVVDAEAAMPAPVIKDAIKELEVRGATFGMYGRIELKDGRGIIRTTESRPGIKIRLEIPVDLGRYGGTTLRDLVKLRSTFPPSDFTRSFPELSRLTAGYPDSLLPKDVDIILARDGEHDAGALSSLGLSIPREAILVIALPLLLAIQLYFCSTLNALNLTLSYSEKSVVGPWLGLYSGILAKVLCIMTVLALPAGSALATILRSSRTSSMWQLGVGWGGLAIISLTGVWSMLLVQRCANAYERN